MFPEKFIWGAATASAQIEGGYNAGGRSPSVWDTAAFYKCKENIFNFNSPHIACDHYHKWKEDVALMKKIGLKAYRFSLSWSRLIPDGYGKLNPQGVKFYSDLIDELLKNDIEPFITLFHWDYPQVLLDQGGWLNPNSVKWFENYAKECVKLFSDRVKVFMTMNEPECFVNLGYTKKRNAPFYDLPEEVVFNLQHNVLKANGAAVIAMRENAKQPIQIGQAFAQGGKVPVSLKKEDIEAAKKAFFDNSGNEFWGNWFVNTIVTGEYDQRKLNKFKGEAKYSADDMKLIHQTPDFIGVNQYTGHYVKSDGNNGYEIVPFGANTDYTAMNWAVVNDCMFWTCKMLYDKYKLPLYITENGVALSEWPDEKGQIADSSRIQYIKNHLRSVEKAINYGVPVKGYFYWSLMDNFEWSYGNSKRFGLIRINYDTLERTLKDSAYWYGDVIKTNGGNIL